AERTQYSFVKKRDKWRLRSSLYDCAQKHPATGRIAILCSGLELQRFFRKERHCIRRALAVAGSQDAIVGVFRLEACHLSHHLTDCHRPLLVRKIRNILLNLVIQLQPAFVQEQANCSRGEYDGSGSGSKPALFFNSPTWPFMRMYCQPAAC